MGRMAFFADMMGTLFERRPRVSASPSPAPVFELCEALLSPQGEISGARLSRDILSHYRSMTPKDRRAFFDRLADDFDLDPTRVIGAAEAYRDRPDVAGFARLCREAEPRRQELFRRLNQVPGATEDLVRMRLDLLRLLPEAPQLGRIDIDLQHLLGSWFNRGFLVLRPIDWRTPANILEKIIEYEAVHAINEWNELQRRLRPDDRRCFAFFHPTMPEEPLIFVEVALCRGVPASVQGLLAEEREVLASGEADTAVFYSISNCQEGLRGISFGNSLIKQVVEEIKRDLPQISRYVTLSPIPGLSDWLRSIAPQRPAAAEVLEAAETLSPEAMSGHAPAVRQLAAEYLLTATRENGAPVDPVARFHLGNGALIHDVHPLADTSPNGFRQSCTAMVNYLYDLAQVELNNERFVTERRIAAARPVQVLVQQGQAAGRRP